jgi:hypothetical protein
MGKYFVYRHSYNENGKHNPFYIGVGSKSDNRSYTNHVSEYRRAYDFKQGRNPHWKHTFEKHSNIEVEIMYECDSSEEIQVKEKEFIALYGRKIDINSGLLVNIEYGGGKAGMIMPIEVCIKISKSNKGKKKKPFSEEHKAKLSAARMGYVPTEQARLNMAKAGIKRHKEKPYRHTDETKKIIGLKSIGNKHCLGKRNNLGKKFTKEHKLKISESHKGKIVTDETKEKLRKLIYTRKRGYHGYLLKVE